MSEVSRKVIGLAALLAATAATAAPAAKPPAPVGSTDAGARTFSPADNPPSPPAVTPELMALGERVFRGACAGCHGSEGKGDGFEGNYITIPPRDFTQGQFILRSTQSGSLPLDKDLFRTIRRGIRPDIAMAAFTFLTDREVYAVINYIKTLSTRWKEDPPGEPIVVPEPPPPSAEMLTKGKEIFTLMQCASCHGEKGRGDGTSAPQLTYDSGKPIKPADFTHPENFKGGSTVKDVFKRFSTGMDGTPMPSYFDTLSEEQRWQLAYYVLAFGAAQGVAQK